MESLGAGIKTTSPDGIQSKAERPEAGTTKGDFPRLSRLGVNYMGRGGKVLALQRFSRCRQIIGRQSQNYVMND